MPAFTAETSVTVEFGKRALLTGGSWHRKVIMHLRHHLDPAPTTADVPSLAEAGTEGESKTVHLLGRKSVLMGILTSGFVVAKGP
jgi:hypothetical protein